MDSGSHRALLAASVAGLLAAVGTMMPNPSAQAAEDTKVPCYGINKCKGVGECAGKGHTCAGMNGCSGQSYLKLDKETCLKIQGGRLTAEPEQKSS